MIELPFDLNFLRIALAIGMLGYASYTDVTKREISDFVWVIFGALAAVLLIFEPNLTDALMNIGYSLIIAPIVLIMWRVGFFGGADAFALIALAVIAPMATLSENPITPFTTLSNAVVLFVIPFLVNVFRNVIAQIRGENIFEGFDETTAKKIIAILMGYRAKNPKFGFAIEKTKKGKKRLDLKLHHAENQDFCTKPDTWITPGIPYLLLITGGFLIQLFYGDVILGKFLGM